VSKPCSICISPDAAAINESVRNGIAGNLTARQYGISTSALSRHRDHIPNSDASNAGSPHAIAAEAVIEAVRVLSKGEINEIDEAEVQQFRSLAAALDARPADPTLLREYRLTQAAIKKSAIPAIAEDEQMEMAQLIASMSRAPERADQAAKVYAAGIAAGSDETTAIATARAIDPHYGETWHQTMARLHPEKAAEYLAADMG
jgi:hypothetical protein